MNKDRKTSLKDQVYREIIEMIINGEIKSDEIITESQLVEHFQVSKSPVREALLQLCTEEILHSIPRCGYQIVQINSKVIHDLAELRCYLELSSLQKLSGILTVDMIRQMQDFLNRDGSESKDMWAHWKDNIRFHLMLTEFVGNTQVTTTLRRVLSTCTMAYVQVYELDRSSIVFSKGESYHQLIVNALENHEFYKAHEYLKTDILLTEKKLLNKAP